MGLKFRRKKPSKRLASSSSSQSEWTPLYANTAPPAYRAGSARSSVADGSTIPTRQSSVANNSNKAVVNHGAGSSNPRDRTWRPTAYPPAPTLTPLGLNGSVFDDDGDTAVLVLPSDNKLPNNANTGPNVNHANDIDAWQAAMSSQATAAAAGGGGGEDNSVGSREQLGLRRPGAGRRRRRRPLDESGGSDVLSDYWKVVFMVKKGLTMGQLWRRK